MSEDSEDERNQSRHERNFKNFLKIISNLIGQVGPIFLRVVTCLWTDLKRWKCKHLLLIGVPVNVG